MFGVLWKTQCPRKQTYGYEMPEASKAIARQLMAA